MLQMIVTAFLRKVCDFSLEDIYCQEFYLISLDVFREVGYAKDDNELTAWLSLLVTNTYEDAELLCQKYPWMEEIFAKISEYVHNPEEVVGMFAEALKMMDDNMYHYMADQYQALIEQWKKDGCTKESAISKITEICKSEDTAKKLIEKYW